MGLQLQDLSYSVAGTAILHSVNLELSLGQIHAVVGPNGAGKSTLFALVAGEYKVMTGDILWNGQSIKHLPMWKRIRLGFGYLPQENLGFSKMTVLDNLLIPSKVSLEACRAMMEELGLQDMAKRRLGLLSGGERRKVDIARLLLLQAKLWIVDEPFSALDSDSIQWMIQILRRCPERGITVLLTDHALAQVMAISDRVSILEKGKIILSETPENLKRDLLFMQRYSIL